MSLSYNPVIILEMFIIMARREGIDCCDCETCNDIVGVCNASISDDAKIETIAEWLFAEHPESEYHIMDALQK